MYALPAEAEFNPYERHDYLVRSLVAAVQRDPIVLDIIWRAECGHRAASAPLQISRK